MSFMQPEITYNLFLVIETRDGDTVLPADAAGKCPVARLGAAWPERLEIDELLEECQEAQELESTLRPYLETHAPIQSVTAKHAWGARLSAPGYMDCTPWSLYDSEAEAREAMAEETGDDEGEG